MESFNILVIGNGVDIAHGLPTKYVQFLEFADSLKQFDSGNLCNNSQYFDYFVNTKANKPELYKELKSLVVNNCWIDALGLV